MPPKTNRGKGKAPAPKRKQIESNSEEEGSFEDDNESTHGE